MSSGRKQSRIERLSTYGAPIALAALAALGIGGAIAGCGAKSTAPSTGESEGTASAAAPSGPYTPKGFTRIERGAHPLAKAKYDVGLVDPNRRLENLSIVFKLSPEQQADHDALLAAQLDPGSPSYHKWLTPETYAARFGAKPADIERTRTWLAEQGLEVKDTSPLGARVSFGGTVANIQSAFQTEIHNYQLGPERHYAMAMAPAVPTELSSIVLGIHNTHDFYPHPMARPTKVIPAPSATCPTGGYCTKGGYGIAPPDWKAIYDVPTTVDGTGVKIGIVGISEIAQGDIDAFRTLYGLPATRAGEYTMILVPGTGPAAGTNGAGIEAILDTEWSGAIAQNADVYYYYSGLTSGNPDDAAYYAIEEDTVSIISESFGGCELGQTPSDADLVGTFGSAANLLGITYLASSGDEGADGCGNIPESSTQVYSGLYVEQPASYPGVTAVGGTEFPTGDLTFGGDGYATGYSADEEVWNESDGKPPSVGPTGIINGPASGSGGISAVFARPSYQSLTPTCVPVGTLPTTSPGPMREVPDVSFTAAGSNNGVFIECSIVAAKGDCGTVSSDPKVVEIGGTSASSPSFAGVVGLITQAAGGGRLGNINPLLYTLATQVPTAFHDITNGNNEIACKPGTDTGCPAGGLYGYTAIGGYDCASGLGSIDVTNLVNAWKALEPTTTSLVAAPTTTALNANVNLTATVTGSGTVGGNVTFTFQTYYTNDTWDNNTSWTLGVAPVTSGTATLSVPIPPGLIRPGAQYVDLVAMYGGDQTHLASTSSKFRVTFPASGAGALSFCVQPNVQDITPGQELIFVSSGGVLPVNWYIDSDTTCTPATATTNPTNCSNLNQTTGVFTAGTGQPGYVLVAGFDSAGEYTFGELSVGAVDGGGAPWEDDAGLTAIGCPFTIDAGPLPSLDDGGLEDSGPGDSGPIGSVDSGPPGGNPDSGPTTTNDGGPQASTDAGPGSSTSSSSGCSCTTAGRSDGAPAGLLGGLVLGLGLVARRRRPRK